MEKHGAKMIAPIVVVVLISLYIAAYAVGFILLDLPLWVCFIGGLAGLIFIGVMIGVLISRIKEIRSGEEDDLGNY